MLPNKVHEVIADSCHSINIFFRDCAVVPCQKFLIRCLNFLTRRNEDLIVWFPFLHKSQRGNNIIPSLFCVFGVLFDFLRFFLVVVLLQKERKEEAQMFFLLFYIIFICLNWFKFLLSINHGYRPFVEGYSVHLLLIDSWMFPVGYLFCVNDPLLYYVLFGIFAAFSLILDISLMVVVILNYCYYTEYHELDVEDDGQ